jgi:hypothetical protein
MSTKTDFGKIWYLMIKLKLLDEFNYDSYRKNITRAL